jgi:protein TonB
MKSNWKRHLFSSVIMVAGCAGVFALLHLMNGSQPPDKNKGEQQRQIMHIQPKKQPPKTARRTTSRRRIRSQSRAKAPLPVLASGLSGNAFGIPSLQQVDLSQAGQESGLSDKAIEQMVMTEEAVDQPPKPLRRIEPAYPRRARAKGISGQVTLSVMIDSSGKVSRVRVLEASPPGVFEEEAKKAVARWEFEPARYKGQAVTLWKPLTIHFNLS